MNRRPSGNFNWRHWLNLLIAAMIALSLSFTGLTLWFSYQHAQAYLHPARLYASGELLRQNDIPYQSIELVTEDGLRLAAWYTPPQNGAVILVAHGYGDKRPEEFYALFASHGYGVLVWDFRAHGDSEGDFSSLGYYEVMDVKAALDYALAQPGVKHVGGWGGSMGAVAMIRAAAEYPEMEAVVSDSAFPTLEDVYQLNVPVPVLQPLIRFFAERGTGISLEAVRAVDEIGSISPRPIFIIDGWSGAAVEMNAPYRLYDAAKEPKRIWVGQGVPHLNMYPYNRGQYAKRVIQFFNEYLLNKTVIRLHPACCSACYTCS